MNTGNLVISLDFELHWGAVEKWNLKERKEYFDNARTGIPFILDLFDKYQIHATWATVGFLFAKNKSQLKKYIPEIRPAYNNSSLDYYKLVDKNNIGDSELDDPYHYAPSLIELILKTPNQELASHTYSHYYCNEPGQTSEQFENDLISAQKISLENFKIDLKSLILPRNQFNPDYLEVALRNGIRVVRPNPDVWFWKRNSRWSPVFRALDTLIPISGSLSYKNPCYYKNEILLLPASRFLRPYNYKERSIQFLKKNRVFKEMTHAAKYKKIYHLWWHPHNFGNELQENLNYLEDVLKHYEYLRKEYNFSSFTMLEMKELFNQKK